MGTATMPSITYVVWEERIGRFIFVAVPNERGRYLRTDRSVALIGCPVCGAVTGEPCREMVDGHMKYKGTTHCARRNRARYHFNRNLDSANDVLKPHVKTTDLSHVDEGWKEET